MTPTGTTGFGSTWRKRSFCRREPTVVRGDSSRSTEGSGLGLSIAKSLTELMQGTFQIFLDGDLFHVEVMFPHYQEQQEEMEKKV